MSTLSTQGAAGAPGDTGPQGSNGPDVSGFSSQISKIFLQVSNRQSPHNEQRLYS